jgi:transketolase
VVDTNLRALRQQIIRITAESGEGHAPSSLSVLDLLYVLHKDVMGASDRFVLSKGHAALALYVVLAHMGRISQWSLDHFCEDGSFLLGHPERCPDYGIEATTGSLGHGIGLATGLALAERISGRNGRVFCVIGDGEAEEGEVWSAAAIAARQKLGNLVVLVDANGTSPNRIDGIRHATSLCEKFRAFGFFISRINGHDHPSIIRSVQPRGGDMPFAVICDTKKGCGVPIMEAEPQVWHHRAIGFSELHTMLESVQ